MGFFDFLFGSKAGASSGGGGGRFRFTRTRQFHEELYHELKELLTESQRKKVEAVLGRYMGGGGVTHGEIDTWIVRDLRKLRDDGELSRIEFDSVMEVLRKHQV